MKMNLAAKKSVAGWAKLKNFQIISRLRRGLALAVAFAFALTPVTPSSFAGRAGAEPAGATRGESSNSSGGCAVNSARGQIQHVIYVQFDNLHFTRDNPNVPSDLEQMPTLLNFIEGQGVLLSNHHTPLISHTANDILTSLTGVYPDQHGVPVANSFRYFNPNGTTNLGVSFAYWTSPLFDPTTSTATDTKFNMLTAAGNNAPAPWVAYTRAGCNFGSVATANTILENTAIDIPTVFGAGSPEALEVTSNPGQAFADFVGIGSTARLARLCVPLPTMADQISCRQSRGDTLGLVACSAINMLPRKLVRVGR